MSGRPAPRGITKEGLISALEILLQALREGDVEGLPLVKPSDSRAGRPCPDHLRELVQATERGRTVWRCPVQGCRQRVE